MSLTATVLAAVETAFAAAGDLVQSPTWRKPTYGAYDPAAGTRTVTNTDLTVRAIEDEVSQRDAERLKLSNKAVKLIIPAVDFTGGDPAFEDKVVHRGTVYTARECSFAGAKAVWEIHADV